MMDDEVFEKKATLKWHQMTTKEKLNELEMLGESSHFKLFSIIFLQKKLKDIT